MKCRCVEIKLYNSNRGWLTRIIKRVDGHSYAYERYYDKYDITDLYDCEKCRYRFACLIDPECNREFKSK